MGWQDRTPQEKQELRGRRRSRRVRKIRNVENHWRPALQAAKRDPREALDYQFQRARTTICSTRDPAAQGEMYRDLADLIEKWNTRNASPTPRPARR